jgi:hypothetical protein
MVGFPTPLEHLRAETTISSLNILYVQSHGCSLKRKISSGPVPKGRASLPCSFNRILL